MSSGQGQILNALMVLLTVMVFLVGGVTGYLIKDWQESKIVGKDLICRKCGTVVAKLKDD